MARLAHPRAACIIFATLTICAASGCGVGQPLYRPADLAQRDALRRAEPLHLAVFEEQSFLSRFTQPAGSQPSDGATAGKPTRDAASQPGAPRYTSPAGALQAMTFLATAVGTAESASLEEGGREVSQSSVSRGGVAARPELQGALNPVTGMVIGRAGPSIANPGNLVMQTIGRRGLLTGGALGGGLSGNLFQPRVNPIGPRCDELVRAGFFPNATACRASFSR